MEHKFNSLAGQVFDRLEMEILSGTYKRGEILTELTLTTDLGVSRTPIREALQRLEQEHLIELTGKGIKIIGISRQDLEDIYEIRLGVEGMVAAKAAVRITDDELRQLREALELQEFYASKSDADHMKNMDSQFHQLLYSFGGSNVFCDVLTPLHNKVQKFRKVSVQNPERAMVSVQEHKTILDALAAHDPVAAEKSMRMHIENAKAQIIGKEDL